MKQRRLPVLPSIENHTSPADPWIDGRVRPIDDDHSSLQKHIADYLQKRSADEVKSFITIHAPDLGKERYLEGDFKRDRVIKRLLAFMSLPALWMALESYAEAHKDAGWDRLQRPRLKSFPEAGVDPPPAMAALAPGALPAATRSQAAGEQGVPDLTLPAQPQRASELGALLPRMQVCLALTALALGPDSTVRSAATLPPPVVPTSVLVFTEVEPPPAPLRTGKRKPRKERRGDRALLEVHVASAQPALAGAATAEMKDLLTKITWSVSLPGLCRGRLLDLPAPKGMERTKANEARLGDELVEIAKQRCPEALRLAPKVDAAGLAPAAETTPPAPMGAP